MGQTRMKRRELGCAKLNAKPQWRGPSEMSVVGRDWRMDGSDDSTGWPSWRIRCRILAGVLRGTQHAVRHYSGRRGGKGRNSARQRQRQRENDVLQASVAAGWRRGEPTTQSSH